MALQPINSVMKLILPANVPLDIDPKFRGYVEELTNAIEQLQAYVEQYCGITQKIQSQWSGFTPDQTLLEHQLNRLYVQATETILNGAMVNLYLNGSTLGARNANATNNTKPAHAFCSTSGGAVAGSYCEVIALRGVCTNISGLTIGQRYFLSTTNGLISTTEAVAAGNIGQFIGVALAANILLVDINSQFNQH